MSLGWDCVGGEAPSWWTPEKRAAATAAKAAHGSTDGRSQTAAAAEIYSTVGDEEPTRQHAEPVDGQRRPKILCIDDNAAILGLLQVALGLSGYRVETATDGWNGLRLAETLLPDVILLDLLMPGMTGEEVLRRLHENEVTSSIPVIVLTAKLAIGGLPIVPSADDLLAKPFDLEDLERKVAFWSARPQPARIFFQADGKVAGTGGQFRRHARRQG